MKKTIFILLISLMSCSIPIVSKTDDKNTKAISNIGSTVNNTKVKEECIPYENVGKFPTNIYTEKSPIKKEKPYLGKIKMTINPYIMPPNRTEQGNIVEIKKENESQILSLEKKRDYVDNISGIRINTNDSFYIISGRFYFYFNNSCEIEYFKNNYTLLSFNSTTALGDTHLTLSIDIDKILLKIEDIETLLHEYNKQFTLDIEQIEFSDIGALKSFLLFIKLKTQAPFFYKDFDFSYFYGDLYPTKSN